MSETLKSPGIKILRENRQPVSIKGEDAGKVYVLGIFEWGEVGKPIKITSQADREKKVGGYIPGYYGAKAIDFLFMQGGISEIHAVRTCHYDSGTAQAKKASSTLKGYNHEIENRNKQDTLNITASSEGLLGNKINISTVKQQTTSIEDLVTGAEYITVNSVEGFETGDVIDITGQATYIRCIVTSIDQVNSRLYFKAVTLTGTIESGSVVKTSSSHLIKTKIAEGKSLSTNMTHLELEAVNNINKGCILTIVDKRTSSVSPNSVTVEVTSISGNTIFFDPVGTITEIEADNSMIVSQEFQLKVYLEETQKGKTFNFLSMNPVNEKWYFKNIFKNDYVKITSLGSTENIIGDIPEASDKVYLTGGDDGLTGLDANDFIGNKTDSTGVYAFDKLEDSFAQIICPDGRWSSLVRNIFNYAENKRLWYVADLDFDLTPEQACDFVTNEAMIDSEFGEIAYPHVMWRNPETGVNEVIPVSSGIAGLNARIWSKKVPGYGVWIQSSGVENGVINNVTGLEGMDEDGNYSTANRNVRDILYKSSINPIIKYSPYGYIKYGVRIPKTAGQFTQVGEAVTFLYIEHSIKNGLPWITFSNIDDEFKAKSGSSIHRFLESVRKKGGLKGKSSDEAFIIDTDSLNNTETENNGEFYFRIGLAAKKAAEFIYFIFSKKVQED